MSAQALAHLNVLDLTHYVAGPFCTKLLAGYGAEVIKVERPGVGDVTRSAGPFYRDEPGPERSIPFLWLNTGKKSVTLNLKCGEGVRIVKELARRADVVVENFSPGVLPRLGLGYEELRRINPRLVMTSVSNFGQSGPRRDYEAEEITEYAMSGPMHLTGDPAREPLCSGPLIAQKTAGMHAYIATLMALYRRGADGPGEHVDVSIQESVMDNIEIALVEQLHQGKSAKRKNDEHPMAPWQVYPCRDGHAAVIGGPVRNWLKAVEMFEEPRLSDEKFRHMSGRIKRREEFAELLKPWLGRHGKKEIYHAGQARGLAFGYLATLAEAYESPQHQARGYFDEVEREVTGTQRYCGAPFRPSETPWRAAPAPLLGEHNEEVYGRLLGYAPEELGRLGAEGVI